MKICIIAGCSQKKLSYAAPAAELNQGQLFRSIKKLANNFHFDLKILSGKHGILDQDEIIEPYNQKIRTKRDISDVRNKAWPKLEQIHNSYERIIIIMGSSYREVLEPFFDNKFIIIFDKRGIGGYLSLLSKYNKLSRDLFLEEIEKFRVKENQKIKFNLEVLEVE